jgi:hypothetical protein
MTTNAISSNPAHDEIRSIQHYVIKFVSGQWFSQGTLVSSNKTDNHDIHGSGIKHHDPNPNPLKQLATSLEGIYIL